MATSKQNGKAIDKQKLGIYDLVQSFKEEQSDLIQRLQNALSECEKVTNGRFKCSLRTCEQESNEPEIGRFQPVNILGWNVPIYIDCNPYGVFDSLKNDDGIDDGRHKFAVEQTINYYDGAITNTFIKGKNVQRQKPSVKYFLINAFTLLEQSCNVIVASERSNVAYGEKEAKRRQDCKASILIKQEAIREGRDADPYTREEMMTLTEIGFEKVIRETGNITTRTNEEKRIVLPVTFYCRSGIYESLTCSVIFYYAFKFLGWDRLLIDYADHQRSIGDNKYGIYPTKIYHEDLYALVKSYKARRQEKNKKSSLNSETQEGEAGSNDNGEELVVEHGNEYEETEMDIVDE